MTTSAESDGGENDYPLFRIGEKGCRTEEIPLTRQVVREMMRINDFILPGGVGVLIKLSSRHAICEAEFCFRKSEQFSISGFPKTLTRENGSG